MYKGLKGIIVLALSVAVLALSGCPVLASHKPNSQDPIPEISGVYNDPDHPGVKVRVFVHPEKPSKVSSEALVCNLSDPDSASVVSSAGWKLSSPWTYNLNLGSVPLSVGGSNLAVIAGNGFSDWSNATGNRVNFTRGADTTVSRQAYDNKNIVAWGRTSGSALGVTYVRYYTSSGLVVDVDTIMNKKFAWKWSNSNTCANTDSYDAENIMTHELGHWLGLNDEYDSANFGNATMYGYGSKGEVKKITLTAGDATGAAAIYP